jgi:hypothetical protein
VSHLKGTHLVPWLPRIALANTHAKKQLEQEIQTVRQAMESQQKDKDELLNTRLQQASDSGYVDC